MNLNAIVAGAFLFLVISFLIGIPFMGTGFFLTLSAIAIVNKRLSRGLNNIDKSQSSYHYIKAFDNWMRQQMRVNRTMARCYYPLFFLSFVLGFWHYHINGRQLGELITHKLIVNDPGSGLIFGVPLIIILGVVLMMALFSYLGGRIYNWDLKLVYGSALRKLDEIIADMEELRS
ncbi:hypothetical protein [Roseimarinus sediminis]|uniref:hypothetical protein n=1 Tax=Roseimarinus sediminis TaxID=1610899 RepID=UPI003D1A91E3